MHNLRLLEAFQNPFGQSTVEFEVEELDPTDPDMDGDGYWDGWIGVYGVNRSDNVILYREHLQSGDGIQGADERVDEQVGVHEVDPNDPMTSSAMDADIDRDGTDEHSNIHIGELHWGTRPTDGNENDLQPPLTDDVPDTHLPVEVDHVQNSNWSGNGSPFGITSPVTSVPLTSSIEQNYALYGIDIEFYRSDSLTQQDLRDVNVGFQTPVTPDGLNRKELIAIEDQYHDNNSRLHMVWGPELSNERPQTIIDVFTDLSTSSGVAWHVGSPDAPQVRTVEDDFGIMVARGSPNSYPNTFTDLQSVGMHELGHALSIGWNDDAPIPVLGSVTGEHAYEVYSGNDDPDLVEGIDQTPERVVTHLTRRRNGVS